MVCSRTVAIIAQRKDHMKSKMNTSIVVDSESSVRVTSVNSGSKNRKTSSAVMPPARQSKHLHTVLPPGLISNASQYRSSALFGVPIHTTHSNIH